MMKVVDNSQAILRARNDMDRARQAEQALRNPLITQYFIKARGDHFEKFTAADHSNIDTIKQIHLEIQQLDKFEKHFYHAISKGKTAENWLSKLTDKTKSFLQR